MKKLFFITILSLLSSLLWAQKEVPSKSELKQFKQSKTLVVLSDDPFGGYNFKIKEAFNNTWKVTPFEFISTADYEAKRQDKSYSFLTFDEVWFDKDKTKAKYNFLSLTLGGKYKTQKEMPQLCTIPVSYADVDEDNYLYKLTALIQIIQNHIHFVESTPGLTDINVTKKINDNAYQLKDKELYVIKDELTKAINTEAKFKSLYPYAFKFVTREELEKAIDEKKANIAFLHKVGPEGTKRKARCYNTIIGSKDAEMYYFSYHMINDKYKDGLLEKDLKKIAKAKK